MYALNVMWMQTTQRMRVRGRRDEDCAGGDEVVRWSVVWWFGGVGGIGFAVWSLVRNDWNRRLRVGRLESRVAAEFFREEEVLPCWGGLEALICDPAPSRTVLDKGVSPRAS